MKRFNWLILLFRLASFSFSLASFIFMASNSHPSGSPRWFDFDAFRYVMAANAMVAVYSLLEMVASVWEISKDASLFPEFLQVWFELGHDQPFAYLLMSANSAGTQLATTLKGSETCRPDNSFCVQSDISIALGFDCSVISDLVVMNSSTSSLKCDFFYELKMIPRSDVD